MHAVPRTRDLLTDVTPVDFVATACTHLIRSFLLDYSKFGDIQCFHLWNDKYISFYDVAQCCDEFGMEVDPIEYEDWLNKIKDSDPRRYVRKLLHNLRNLHNLHKLPIT
jgi:hypothetical protein